MKLNLNSPSAKLYRWFYGVGYMPNSLCPYFWKLVIAYIFALPVLVFTLPYTILKLAKIDSIDDESQLGFRLFVSVISWGFLFVVMVLLSPITLFFNTYPKHGILRDLIRAGFLSWIAVIGIGICFLIRAIHNKYSEKKYEGKYEEKPNIVIEMVKAKYNKYCPKIDWK